MEDDYTLTDEELADFHRNGYFGPFPVYEVEEMQRRWRRERLRLLERSNTPYVVSPARLAVPQLEEVFVGSRSAVYRLPNTLPRWRNSASSPSTSWW